MSDLDKSKITYSMRATTTVDGQMLTAQVELTREFIEDAAINVASYAANHLDVILQREVERAHSKPNVSKDRS